MYCEWYGVCDFVVLSVVEVCADYGGVNVFHVVHPVAILSAVFCFICSLLMFVSDAISDHMVDHTHR